MLNYEFNSNLIFFTFWYSLGFVFLWAIIRYQYTLFVIMWLFCLYEALLYFIIINRQRLEKSGGCKCRN